MLVAFTILRRNCPTIWRVHRPSWDHLNRIGLVAAQSGSGSSLPSRLVSEAPRRTSKPLLISRRLDYAGCGSRNKQPTRRMVSHHRGIATTCIGSSILATILAVCSCPQKRCLPTSTSLSAQSRRKQSALVPDEHGCPCDCGLVERAAYVSEVGRQCARHGRVQAFSAQLRVTRSVSGFCQVKSNVWLCAARDRADIRASSGRLVVLSHCPLTSMTVAARPWRSCGPGDRACCPKQ
jgi:hypothetical protein